MKNDSLTKAAKKVIWSMKMKMISIVGGTSEQSQNIYKKH